MRRALGLAIAVAVLAAAGFLGLRLVPRAPSDVTFQGYVEGYLLSIAPEEGGRIERLEVDAGAQVAPGQLLFRLESATQEAQRGEAEARARQAAAQLADLRAAQQRPEQVAVLQAQERRASATLELSRNEFQRQQSLFQKNIAAKAQLDQAESAFRRDTAAMQEVQRQIDAARLSGRASEIDAAEAAARATDAALRQAETRLDKRRVSAPASGRVQDVYFRPGEVVNAGQPVLAMLPPANLRIRFFVPEPRLATLTLGGTVTVSCDSCREGLAARISFMAREVEFTPPVIFSDKERAKLVFRVEATPLDHADLPLGLPVQVRPADLPPEAR